MVNLCEVDGKLEFYTTSCGLNKERSFLIGKCLAFLLSLNNKRLEQINWLIENGTEARYEV